MKKECSCFKPIDITDKREISIFRSNIKKVNTEDDILVINFGGDGSLFSSLSLTAESLEKNNIYTISFNFGNKGFYCFYPREMLMNFLNGELNLLETSILAYENQEFIEGYFWKVNNQYYFIGDTVIKPYIHYKTIKLEYYIDKKNIEEICDGIIIFTTFGSTGYFLSINGIYIDTGFSDLIGISFIAPHSLKHRAQLFKNKEIVVLNKDRKNAILLTDGQDKLIIEPQESISINKSEKKFILIGNKNIFTRWIENFYEK
ncbi:MAG: hypothetical protein N2169_01310 [bacterium]|nr:hypothetical protein [bacterium]